MASTPKSTTTTTAPWKEAAPYIKQNYADFASLLEQGAPQAWSGPLIAESSQATKDSLSMAENIARNGNTAVLSSASNAVNGVLNSGVNQQASNTLSQLQQGSVGTNPTNSFATSVMNGGNNSAPGSYNLNYSNPALSQASGYGGYTNAASGLQAAQASQLASGNNPAMDYLRSTADGSQIGKNPYLDSMVSNSQDAIAKKLQDVTNPAISSQAASLGRMGSGAFASQLNNAQSAAANEMAKVSTDLYANQYNSDRQNQMAAAGQLGNFYNSDVSNALNSNQALASTDAQQQQLRQAGTSLYGSLSDSQNAARLNASNAANAQFNQNNQYQMQGAQLASNNHAQSIADMLNLNQQKLSAANSQISADSALAGTKLNAASQAGQQYQNSYLPSQALSGVGTARDNYNTGSLQAQIDAWNTSQQQPLQNIANFNSLLTNGGFNSTTQPVYSNTTGQALGALSSLAGLFALCTRELKTIHSFVGVMPLTNGGTINIYEFSYTDDAENTIYVGPIAEEVEEALPGTVIEFSGKKHIDVEAFMKEAA